MPEAPPSLPPPDVDDILPLGWLAEGDQHIGFWEAQQRTNAELESEGLYLTHLFREVDVILRPDWLRWRVQIPLAMRHLQVFRPATLGSHPHENGES